MGIEQLTFIKNVDPTTPTEFTTELKDKVEVAIERLRYFEPPEGYYLAFSGGKDSVVIYDLAVKAGVKFDAHYNLTGIDPPELVQFIRQYYPTVIWNRPHYTMWHGIQEHGMPSRYIRWCCAELKELAGDGRRIITGVRWDESVRRSKRKMLEPCNKGKGKYYLNPIIDWTCDMKTKDKMFIKEGDVWNYILGNNLPYCSLYDENFTRLGCVLCPMATKENTIRELNRFPKLAEAWHRACIRRFESRQDLEFYHRFSDAETYWQWWLSRENIISEDQPTECFMFE